MIISAFEAGSSFLFQLINTQKEILNDSGFLLSAKEVTTRKKTVKLKIFLLKENTHS
jgi:hypothetical protein